MQNKFRSVKTQIKKLIDNKGLENQKELLEKLYKYFKKNTDKSRDEWVESVQSNFSSMKLGQRDFPLEWKHAISEYTGLSFTAFVEERDKNEYEPFGIKGAAATNDLDMLKRLAESENGSTPLGNYDEFEKTIYDYIAEYTRKDGKPRTEAIKFLAQARVYPAGRAENISDIFISVIKADDYDSFARLCNMIGVYMRDITELRAGRFSEHKDLYPGILPHIIKTTKILENLIEQKNDEGELEITETALSLLEYAVDKGELEIAEKIFATCEKYTRSKISTFINEHGLVSQNDLHSYYYGHNCGVCIAYKGRYDGAEIKTVNFSDDLADKLEAIYGERFDAITPNGVALALTKKNFSDMTDGEIFEDRCEGRIFHKTSKSLDYEMLEAMARAGIKCVPEYFGEDNGVQISEYVYYHPYISIEEPPIICAARAFNEIHTESERLLGKGRVYLHKNAANGIQSITVHRGRAVMGGWIGNTEIGSPQKALIEAALACLPSSATVSYPPFEQQERKSVESIVKALEIYYEPEIVKNFGSKLLREIEERLESLADKRASDKYRALYIKKMIIDIHINELNSVGCGV